VSVGVVWTEFAQGCCEQCWIQSPRVGEIAKHSHKPRVRQPQSKAAESKRGIARNDLRVGRLSRTSDYEVQLLVFVNSTDHYFHERRTCGCGYTRKDGMHLFT
jgi:hypothetical protein